MFTRARSESSWTPSESVESTFALRLPGKPYARSGIPLQSVRTREIAVWATWCKPQEQKRVVERDPHLPSHVDGAKDRPRRRSGAIHAGFEVPESLDQTILLKAAGEVAAGALQNAAQLIDAVT